MLIAYLHGIIIVFSIVAFIIRYKKNAQAFYLNYFFYLLFFAIFYISIPSIASALTGFSHVGASLETINSTAIIGFYFVVLFFISYLFSKDNTLSLEKMKNIKSPKILFLLKILVTLIMLYVIMALFLNISAIVDVYENRPAQSSLNHYIESTYKIKPLFIVVIVLMSYLFLRTENKKYFLLLLPFVFYDLMLSGRGYIFSSFIVFFILSTINNHIFKLKYLFFGLVLIASISIFRMSVEFDWGHIFQIFYEFIFTWSTVHLMYESSQAQDFFYTINYSFFRLFPSAVYDVFFGTYISYTQITGEANPLGWGLAGSMVAEAVSFKNNLVLLLYPIVVVLYGILVNYMLRTKTYSGIIIFILALVYIQQMFRYSFLEFAMYPFYVLIFFGLYIVAVDLLGWRKRQNRKGQILC